MKPLLLRELFKISSLELLLEASESISDTLNDDKCLSCCMNLILEIAFWSYNQQIMYLFKFGDKGFK